MSHSKHTTTRTVRSRWGILSLVIGIVLFAAVFWWMRGSIQDVAEASEREGLRQAELAVRKAAVSVYALEGAYPATYEDLKAHGGIAIDEDKYQVFYEIFASNIMPEITVVRRSI